MHRRTALALPLLALPAIARAQSSGRPLRMVIPYTPGGSNDFVGRLLADGMASRLNQPVVVENRGGAGGLIGNDVVAKAAGDGQTILLAGSGSFLISSLVQPRLPYDLEKDFAPVGYIGASPNIITVKPSSHITNLTELQAYGRAASGPLRFGTAGVGSTSHALGAMIGVELGIELEAVHYRGTGPALNDMLGGRLDILTNAAAPFLPHLEAGTLKAVAVAGLRRTAALPDVPSSAEQGFPGLNSATWYGLLASGGTPAPRLAELHAALNDALNDPEIKRRLTESGVEVETLPSPAAFGDFLTEDRKRWARVVSRANLKVD
ncbi:tripartite-type tricarboxylate transporter receptor subunit TctC [Humitalea rosea]|uniref:Tripartite-type tricarboxylate transporter receptor subunit TctC n=1 Tax=Humitalea rosea TaxID=990373 RepID=A0A2W7IN68_9PROT|nr:tripartite tricarboxylate transporter substrate-binding protein [Humitalea rosea]PZW40073.1 tripartite-type tricarboxylate transporter receptor subunit TctC [Humitalea rosea]